MVCHLCEDLFEIRDIAGDDEACYYRAYRNQRADDDVVVYLGVFDILYKHACKTSVHEPYD